MNQRTSTRISSGSSSICGSNSGLSVQDKRYSMYAFTVVAVVAVVVIMRVVIRVVVVLASASPSIVNSGKINSSIVVVVASLSRKRGILHVR